MMIRFLLVILFFYSSMLLLNGQNLNEEELMELQARSELCDTSGLKAMEEIIRYYYLTGASPSKERAYINEMISCAQKVNDNNYLSSAYYSLLQHYRWYSSLDSLLIAADLLENLAREDMGLKVQRNAKSATLQKAEYYFSVLDDVENAYKYYLKSIEESFDKGFYGLYVHSINRMSEYYSDDEEYFKAVNLIDSLQLKLPDYKSKENEIFYSRTDMSYLERMLYDSKPIRSFAILYDKGRDSLEVRQAYNDLLGYVKSIESDNPFNALNSIVVILDRMNSLPIDSLIPIGEKGLDIDNKYDFQSNYIRFFHAENLIKTGKINQASKLLDEALAICKTQTSYYYEIASIYNSRASINLLKNETKKARYNFDLYQLYMDSSYQRRKNNDIENVETKFALRDSESEKRLIEQQQVSLEQRFKLLLIGGSLIFLALLAALVFYLRMRNTASQLARINEEKNKIFAILAHDLRNPIASLRSLSKKVKFLAYNNRLDELDELEAQTDRKLGALNDNLNNILLWAISKSNLLELQVKEIDLKEETSNLIELYNSEIELKGISIVNTIPKSTSINTDLKVLQTILRNLMSNAIKFSTKDSVIKIESGISTNYLELNIKDNGIGLPQEGHVESDEIKSQRNQLKGSGVGIKLCNELASRAGISLTLKANPEGGTISNIQFPLVA